LIISDESGALKALDPVSLKFLYNISENSNVITDILFFSTSKGTDKNYFILSCLQKDDSIARVYLMK